MQQGFPWFHGGEVWMEEGLRDMDPEPFCHGRLLFLSDRSMEIKNSILYFCLLFIDIFRYDGYKIKLIKINRLNQLFL